MKRVKDWRRAKWSEEDRDLWKENWKVFDYRGMPMWSRDFLLVFEHNHRLSFP